MREETDSWLHPMIDEAISRGNIDVHQLLRAASMPAAEADTPTTDWLAANTPDMNPRGMDWIRFGQLLKQALGWDDYPDTPDFGAEPDVP